MQCRLPTRTPPPAPAGGVEFFQGTLSATDEVTDARVFDTTLRDGEQAPGTSFSREDKLAIADVLDEMGTHVIEAGFPINSDAEFEAVATIAERTDATTCGLARIVADDVDAALEAGVDMVHVFASTSDVQIEDSMHSTREAVLEGSVEAVEAVDDVGVDWVNVPDTCGVATPGRFRELVGTVREHTDARVDVHTHDDFGMATANALAGFEAGAAQAQVSVNSIGERAGNAAYEEVVMALESVYDVDTGVDTTRIAELSREVERRSGVPVPGNKPVVGDNAFAHESGIHAAGVLENSDTFEPGVMTPEMVGVERSVVLGKHSGTHAVRDRLEEEGFTPTDAEVRRVASRVKAFAADGGEVTPERLRRFAREEDVAREGVEA